MSPNPPSSACLIWLAVIAAALPVSQVVLGQEKDCEIDVAEPYREAAIARWSSDIDALLQLDAERQADENALMLLGSSSIRLWDTAAEAFAPRPVIRRGYGGAKFVDLVVFAERLITPHQFDDLIVFVANDISGSKKDRSPVEVEPLVRHIIEVARRHQPEAIIHLVEVTPTPKRFAVWPAIRELNAMLREVALTEPNVRFVATAQHYLDQQDQPRSELFGDDRLHQNEAGYALWASLLKRSMSDASNP
ncbi:MAG: GDSL-type esterase/lipase family protein [Planctomycetota bacterium]